MVNPGGAGIVCGELDREKPLFIELVDFYLQNNIINMIKREI